MFYELSHLYLSSHKGNFMVHQLVNHVFCPKISLIHEPLEAVLLCLWTLILMVACLQLIIIYVIPMGKWQDMKKHNKDWLYPPGVFMCEREGSQQLTFSKVT